MTERATPIPHFYLIYRFHLSIQTAQFYLVAFLSGIVAGTIAGGAVGDRVGRKPVMLFSILGALPFALLLPTLTWSGLAFWRCSSP